MTQLQNHPSAPAVRFEKTLDTKTVEVLALAVFRTLFRDGIHVPLKMNGTMDMDLVVKDNNVLLNMNQVHTSVPELSIWRITFAYRGKPVVEYGRGIKNDMKVHIPQLCFLMLAAWREKRKNNQARARGDRTRERELVTMSVTEPNTGEAEEVAG
ncbi:MAG: hypothetical protein ABSE66_05770 [Thermoplasmata archaeon]|jgi:hypothetical protein